jgi:hypothetical protein
LHRSTARKQSRTCSKQPKPTKQNKLNLAL